MDEKIAMGIAVWFFVVAIMIFALSFQGGSVSDLLGVFDIFSKLLGISPG